MAESVLKDVDRASPIECMAGVSMAQPVGGDPRINAGTLGNRLDDAMDGAGIERVTRAGHKDQVIIPGAVAVSL